MSKATSRAHSEFRNVTVFRVLHIFDGKKPETIPGIVAGMLCDQSNIPLYGICPPGEKFELIPKEDAEALSFSDDASSLVDSFQKGFDGCELVKFTNVAIKNCDLQRRFREIVGQ